MVHTRPAHARHSGVALVLALLLLPTALLSAQGLSVQSQDGVTKVTHDGQPLLEYQSAPHPAKMYISRWFTPGGVQVLRDSPHDHVHHHALMFALGIDDVDFWSEVPAENYGRQESNNIASSAASDSSGMGEVEIKQAVRWVAPNREVLAEEARKIRAHIGVIPGASLLTWQFTLRPAEGQESMKLWGRHYFGLGMRFVETMDTGSEFVTPGDVEGVTVRGTEKLTRAPWCAVYGDADGKPITVAMFDAPDNLRHPATWFTMTSGFAYLAATLNLDDQVDGETLSIVPDKPLKMRYGVAVWDGKIGLPQIEQAYQKWLKLQ